MEKTVNTAMGETRGGDLGRAETGPSGNSDRLRMVREGATMRVRLADLCRQTEGERARYVRNATHHHVALAAL